MKRRDFLKGAAALGACAVSAQDHSPTGREDLDTIQREIDEVTPAQFGAYNKSALPLSVYTPLEGVPGLAALRRLDAAFLKVEREVRETSVSAGAVPVVWFVYNMGIVVKTAECLFSIDLNHRFAERLAPSLDFALITHNHLDHYTQRFYDAMDGAHKTVVNNFACNYGAYFAKRGGGYTHGGKTFRFGDVEVKTSASDHNGYLIDFTLAFEISIGGFRIYHTGDSANLEKLNPADAPDLWIVHPRCGMKVAEGVRKFHPKKTVIAHLNELGHGKNRWRWTYTDGLHAVSAVEQAGGVAQMPVWGEKIRS